MNTTTIGTCSLCGGAVTVPAGPWMSIIPPVPVCSGCGAVPAQEHGPVIQMTKPGPRFVVHPEEFGGDDFPDWLKKLGTIV